MSIDLYYRLGRLLWRCEFLCDTFWERNSGLRNRNFSCLRNKKYIKLNMYTYIPYYSLYLYVKNYKKNRRVIIMSSLLCYVLLVITTAEIFKHHIFTECLKFNTKCPVEARRFSTLSLLTKANTASLTKFGNVLK